MKEKQGFESKFDLNNLTMENELYIAMRNVCDDPEIMAELPARKKEEADSLEDIYNRVLQNNRITLITPLKNFTKKIQKLEYQCNKCGGKAFARFDMLLPNSEKLDNCKICKRLEKEREREALLWRRTAKFVTGRGGKIVGKVKAGKYWNKEDRIRVECANGHRWNTRFKHIHNNHWCRFCTRDPEIEVEKIKVTDIRKIKGPLRYHVLCQMVNRGGMTMHFWTPAKKYYMVCDKCGDATILSESQMLTRKYLCPNRCTKALQMSFPRFFMLFGFDIADMEQEENLTIAKHEYKEGRENYVKYKAKQLEMPVPKLATTRSRRWE